MLAAMLGCFCAVLTFFMSVLVLAHLSAFWLSLPTFLGFKNNHYVFVTFIWNPCYMLTWQCCRYDHQALWWFAYFIARDLEQFSLGLNLKLHVYYGQSSRHNLKKIFFLVLPDL